MCQHPSDLADHLELSARGKEFLVIDRSELLVVLAALRFYGANVQRAELRERPAIIGRASTEPTVFRKDGRVETIGYHSV